MANRVSELMDDSVFLAFEMFKTQPEQYTEDRYAAEPLGKAWNKAVELTIRASIAVEELAELLARRAGVTLKSLTNEASTDSLVG